MMNNEVKAKIAMFIREKLVERLRSCTQEEIAQVIKVTQPKISHLLRLDTSGFGFERLLNIINLLGYDVEINVTDSHAEKGRLTIKTEG